MTGNLFKEVEIPELQKSRNGIAFPIVMFPNPEIHNSQLSVLIEGIQAHKPWLESRLHQSGAILFRGFPVSSPSDFNDVIEAFGYPEMPYTAGAARRTQVVGRVFTANEGPPDQKVGFHHEMAYCPEYPTKLFFFCEVQPGSGGETAIAPSYLIYSRMEERYPEFVKQLEEHGVSYGRPMPSEDDLSSAGGRSWKSTFSTDDKSVAEQRAADVGIKLEWMENGSAIGISTPRPAFNIDNAGRKTWFNLLASCGAREDVTKSNVLMIATFGNGKPLPRDAVSYCLNMMEEEESVAIPWQKGDFLLVDNLAAQHARLPLVKPPRRVLAALCK